MGGRSNPPQLHTQQRAGGGASGGFQNDQFSNRVSPQQASNGFPGQAQGRPSFDQFSGVPGGGANVNQFAGTRGGNMINPSVVASGDIYHQQQQHQQHAQSSMSNVSMQSSTSVAQAGMNRPYLGQTPANRSDFPITGSMSSTMSSHTTAEYNPFNGGSSQSSDMYSNLGQNAGGSAREMYAGGGTGGAGFSQDRSGAFAGQSVVNQGYNNF
jgi:hypothetical protein